MENLLQKVVDPEEAALAKSLSQWFVAEEAFLGYFEEIEEEGDYPDLYGKNLLVSELQYPAVHRMVQEICEFLELEPPRVFVYESYQQLCDSEGIKSPRLELSARMIRNFSDNELRHELAKELYHIKSGHIRLEVMTDKILGLIDAVPNLPGLNVVNKFGGAAAFGFMAFNLRDTAFRWFRSACFSAENFAVCYTGDLKASVDATLMTILNERQLVDEVVIPAYIGQISAIETIQGPAATMEKINEVLPYGPYRVLNMLRFVTSVEGQEYYQFCRQNKGEN